VPAPLRLTLVPGAMPQALSTMDSGEGVALSLQVMM
jgi:hypothetical protein